MTFRPRFFSKRPCPVGARCHCAAGERAIVRSFREGPGRGLVTHALRELATVLLVVAGGLVSTAFAETERPPAGDLTQEVEQLRQELDTAKREYADRLAALEARLAALQGIPSTAPIPAPEIAAPPPAAAAPPQAPVPTGAEGGGGPTGSLPVYGGGGAGASKVFNPDISAIGDFIGAAGTSPGGGEPSLELHEAEVGLQAVVDPYARADFFLTWSKGSADVEEAYITFPTLPGDFIMKVGKMRDVFGKVDGMHNHVLPFTDRPLVTKNLTGGEDGLADAGITVSHLIPVGVFLEATGQIYRGQSNIFQAPSRGDLAYVGHLRLYQDVSESSNIDLGGSFASGHNGVGPDTTTRLIGADATFRYKPLRRAIYTHVLARAELVWSRRQDSLGYQNAFGAYGYLEYQFARRWFAGARYDISDRAALAGLRDKGGSFVLTYWPSEFSQVRGQYRHTDFAEGLKANEFLFQFQFSIGAHGAHAF
jgi:hypothetical protein